MEENMKQEVILMGPEEADDFWELRRGLYEAVQPDLTEEDYKLLEAATREYYLAHINEDFYSWGIYQGDEIVAAGALTVFERLPKPEDLRGREGYVVNIYTKPDRRKRGFAGQIVDHIIEISRDNGFKRLWLYATDQGRPVYIPRGFEPKGDEMELLL